MGESMNKPPPELDPQSARRAQEAPSVASMSAFALEQRLASILEVIDDVVYSLDPSTGATLYQNRAVERLTHFDILAFERDAKLWLKLVHPEDLRRVEAS